MNKTVSINLAGLVFQIDEKAYSDLKIYLDAVKERFAGTEGREEIIEDIEARIAEIFSQAVLNENREVVNASDVKNVIRQLGNPEDFTSEDAEEEEEFQENKKLYRDQEDKILGGVTSGISAYLGIKDPLWMRLLFVILVFAGFGSFILIYVLLWIIVPPANTPSEKLSMKGKPITISNIEKTIGEEWNDLVNSKNATAPRTFLTKFIKLTANLLKLLFTFLIKLIGIILILGGTLFLIALIIGLIFPVGFSSVAYPEIINGFLTYQSQFYVGAVALFLFAAIPAVALIYAGIKIFFPYVFPIKKWGAGLGIAWLLAFFTLIFLFFSVAVDFSYRKSYIETEVIPTQRILHLKLNSKGYSSNESRFDLFGYEFIPGESTLRIDNIRIDITPSQDTSTNLIRDYSAAGSTGPEAKKRAENIRLDYRLIDTTLLVDSYFSIPREDKLRDQEADLILEMPIGGMIFINRNITPYLNNVRDTRKMYDHQMRDHLFRMTVNGLECMDCPDETQEEVTSKSP